MEIETTGLSIYTYCKRLLQEEIRHYPDADVKIVMEIFKEIKDLPNPRIIQVGHIALDVIWDEISFGVTVNFYDHTFDYNARQYTLDKTGIETVIKLLKEKLDQFKPKKEDSNHSKPKKENFDQSKPKKEKRKYTKKPKITRIEVEGSGDIEEKIIEKENPIPPVLEYSIREDPPQDLTDITSDKP